MPVGHVGENSKIKIIMEAVKVRVPASMEFVSETKKQFTGGSVVIPSHGHKALTIGKVIVNQNFYGITEQDLGLYITFTVQIFEKNVRGGKKYTAIDFFKINGTSSVYELKVIDAEQAATMTAVPIRGTQKLFCFMSL